MKPLIEEGYPKLIRPEVNVAEGEIAAHNSIFTIPVLILILESKEYVRLIRAFSIDEVQQKTDRVYSLLFDN